MPIVINDISVISGIFIIAIILLIGMTIGIIVERNRTKKTLASFEKECVYIEQLVTFSGSIQYLQMVYLTYLIPLWQETEDKDKLDRLRSTFQQLDQKAQVLRNEATNEQGMIPARDAWIPPRIDLFFND